LAELFKRIEARAMAIAPAIRVDEQLPGISPIFRYDQIAAANTTPPPPVVPDEHETMLLQHSSGTTGLHKGVMLSHGAVLRHAASYSKALGLTPDDVIASWLPLYHDMGLIACLVTPLVTGTHVVWMSPFEWVVNPALLLQAISKFRCTLAWLPNFAFSFLAQRARPEAGKYDLSSLRQIVNCSEPVRAESMDLFAERFRDCGFRRSALHTCYAMAENVFAISASTTDCPPRSLRVDPRTWQTEHRAQTVAADHAAAIVHVSSGRCVEACEVKVIDEQGQPVTANCAGRLLVRSPFLFSGYHRRDDLNQNLFDFEGFFDTGDLGYVDELGEVYVTGRSKDLIIVGGKNIYPQDVEAAVNSLDHIHPGRVVCFGIRQPETGTEGLVVLAESDASADLWPDLERQICRVAATTLDLDILVARIVVRETLQKSSSGKLARGTNRDWYLQGRFDPPANAARQEDTRTPGLTMTEKA
jgi:fatty-acyl-CoA synthase